MRKRRMQRAEQRTTLVAPVVALARSVFSVFFPPDCRLGSLPRVNISRLPVCEECLASLEPIRAPQCGERLMPAQLPGGDGRGHGCYEFQPDFDRGVSHGEYDEAVRGLILLKYDPVMPAAPVLGRLLAEAVQHLELAEDCDALPMPVPLHASKRRERRVNQSKLIARSECAPVLKKAGAERVFAATVARTLKGASLPEVAQSQEEVSETAAAVSV